MALALIDKQPSKSMVKKIAKKLLKAVYAKKDIPSPERGTDPFNLFFQPLINWVLQRVPTLQHLEMAIRASQAVTSYLAEAALAEGVDKELILKAVRWGSVTGVKTFKQTMGEEMPEPSRIVGLDGKPANANRGGSGLGLVDARGNPLR